MTAAAQPIKLTIDGGPEAGDDGTQLLKQVHGIVKDLMEPSKLVYWGDLLGSAALGYGAMAVAVNASSGWVIAGAVLVSVLALYRGALFIHELTHVRGGALPGFYNGWNAVIGVPLLLPSFLYDGVHQLHHAKTKYGTLEDPEYIFIKRRSALMTAWLIGHALILPVALFLRFAIGTPLGLLFPPVQRFLIERASSLATNPDFRRKLPRDADRRRWLTFEIACWLWSWTLIALVATGTISLRAFGIMLLIEGLVTFVNQVRTLAAHHWDNEEGHEMTIAGQLLDSVNCPETAWVNELWAPVGLRFHALHHLMPGLPYHNLAAAHKRLLGALPAPQESIYRRTVWDSLLTLLRKVSRPKATIAT